MTQRNCSKILELNDGERLTIVYPISSRVQTSDVKTHGDKIFITVYRC